MDQTALRKLLEEVRAGALSPDEALGRLRHLPFEDLGFAKIDHHRPLRVGMPEVIYSAGKTPEQVAEVFAKMAEHGKSAMSDRDCTLACVKGGGKYVFVEGGKVYNVENQDAAGLQEHAGHTVRLTGEMNGDSIKVSKIEMGAAEPTRRRRTSPRSGLSSFARTGASGASAPDCGCAAEHLL